MKRGEKTSMGFLAVYGEHMFNCMEDPVFGIGMAGLHEKITSSTNDGFWPQGEWASFLTESWKLGELDGQSLFPFMIKLFRGTTPGYILSHVSANWGDALLWASMCSGAAPGQILCPAWHYGGNDGEKTVLLALFAFRKQKCEMLVHGNMWLSLVLDFFLVACRNHNANYQCM